MVLNNAIEQNESIMTVEICKPLARLLDIEWYLSRYIAMPGLKGARRIMRSESHPLGARESTIMQLLHHVASRSHAAIPVRRNSYATYITFRPSTATHERRTANGVGIVSAANSIQFIKLL